MKRAKHKKDHKEHQVNVKFDSGTFIRLKQMAHEEERSLADTVRRMIRRCLEQVVAA